MCGVGDYALVFCYKGSLKSMGLKLYSNLASLLLRGIKMNIRLPAYALLLALLSFTAMADDFRFNNRAPIVSATYSSFSSTIGGVYVPAHFRHAHHSYDGRYAANNASPIDPYRGHQFYAAPIVIYNQLPPVAVFSQSDPLQELRGFCAPNVSKVCSGGTCIFCN
jgi:hypothetical protein